jgi:hypothetical protein
MAKKTAKKATKKTAPAKTAKAVQAAPATETPAQDKPAMMVTIEIEISHDELHAIANEMEAQVEDLTRESVSGYIVGIVSDEIDQAENRLSSVHATNARRAKKD